ncbi:hypothetical protein Pcinc_031613 [Petrolisthes cinctipes]|uniref:Uncharacterized protein n=1 Tax=Petrolisthes cinctipes TaxID=88211 RepID=A0AAE1K2D4_PETCI|nr:hypothetical protein Pcinc_031613 [Petrolisthes cinctipes]
MDMVDPIGLSAPRLALSDKLVLAGMAKGTTGTLNCQAQLIQHQNTEPTSTVRPTVKDSGVERLKSHTEVGGRATLLCLVQAHPVQHSEPVGLAGPRLSVKERYQAAEATRGTPATLTCPAQAHPVPQFR